MLKFQLDSLEGLEPAQAALYVEKDGKFYLQVEGMPQQEDTSGLKAKVEQLLAEKKTEAEKRKQAEEEARIAAEEAARKSGDTEALDRSWNEKHTKALTEKDATLTALQAQIHSLTVGAAAARIAGELAVQGSAGVLQRLIEHRLSMEMRDGVPTVVVRDNEGKPTAATLAEFRTEITNDAALAPLVAASKATGGGAPGSNGGAVKRLSEMNMTERAALRQKDPAAYERLRAQDAAH